jgi:hypothetical protein
MYSESTSQVSSKQRDILLIYERSPRVRQPQWPVRPQQAPNRISPTNYVPSADDVRRSSEDTRITTAEARNVYENLHISPSQLEAGEPEFEHASQIGQVSVNEGTASP